MKPNEQLNDPSDNHSDTIYSDEFRMYKRIFNSIDEGIAVLSPDFNILKSNTWLNNAYAKGNDICGQKCYGVFQKRDKPCVDCPALLTIKTGKSQKVMKQYSGDSIRQGWYEVVTHPIYNSRDELVYVIENMRDITYIINKENQLSTALNEAKARQMEMATLLEASNIIPKSNSFETAARGIFDLCKKLIGAKSGYVALLSDNGTENQVLFLDAGGLPCTVDPSLPMPIRGLREIAYRLKDVAYENDFHHSKWVNFMPEGHVKLTNVLFSPLVINNKTVGLMGLANKDGDFTERDVDIARAFGELAAVALTYVDYKAKLIESEKRYDITVGAANIGIWDWDLINDSVYWNDESFKLLGFKPGEFEINYKMWRSLVHPEDIVHAESIVQEALKSGKTFNNEFRYKKKNGEWAWVMTRGKCVDWDKYGKPARMVGTHLDITQEKAAKELARKTQKQFQNVFENIQLIGLMLDNRANVLFANDYLLHLTGYKRSEVIGKNWFDYFVPKEIVSKVKTVFSDTIKKDEFKDTFENEIITRTGETRLIRWNNLTHYDENRKPIIVTSIGEDITEYKLAETKLKLSEELFRSTFEQAAVGIAQVEPNGSFLLLNKKFCEIVGYTHDELIKMNFADITHSEDVLKEQPYIDEVLEGIRDSFIIEKRYIRKDGNVIWVKLHSAAMRDENKQVKFAIAAISDITAQKQLNTDLIKAKEKAEESDKLKSEFLHNLSHEIRTPMNGIIGFSDFLERPNISEHKQKYYTKVIKNSANQLMRIIDDILEISSLETKQVKVEHEEFCLNELLMDLFAIFNLKAADRNVPLFLNKGLSDKHSIIKSDKTKLHKILSNLVENAIKFTTEGSIELGYTIIDNQLKLYVRDTGIGISKENQEIIFQRFSQENKDISCKVGGLGLGLSIAKENTELLGGTISLESEKGKGSTFFVNIPYEKISDKTVTSDYRQVNEPADTDAQFVILVAEDEETNFLYIEEVISDMFDENVLIMHAKNGRQAIDIVNENPGINLVLMDVKMPVVNGLEATKSIKRQRPNLPIIAQTAYATSEDSKLALDSGCDAYIAKPIDADKLELLIKKFLLVKK